MDTAPVIGVTIGDPAGIGPEIVAKALAHPEVRTWCRCVIYGQQAALQRIAHVVPRMAVVQPVASIHEALALGGDVIGHTEMLADLTGSPTPYTMFMTESLRIFFATRHVSLRRACEMITEELVRDTALAADHYLRRLGIAGPHIAAKVHDHGTAFDIAGTGAAREASMVEAIRVAARYARPWKTASATGLSVPRDR